jgi:hypothetical protein
MVITVVVDKAQTPVVGVNVYVVVAVLFNAGDHTPVMPSFDGVCNAVIVAPAQYELTVVNVGVTLGVITIVIVCVTAQIPVLGVKVYVVVAVLFIAGDQLPVIPLLSVVGNELIVAPEQNGPTAVNTGVAFGVIVTVIVVVTAHCPASGVKVYVVVVVLLNAGDHVPVMPFVEVVGKLNTLPAHNGATAANVGVTIGFTVMVTGVTTEH